MESGVWWPRQRPGCIPSAMRGRGERSNAPSRSQSAREWRGVVRSGGISRRRSGLLFSWRLGRVVRKRKKGKGGEQSNITLLDAISGQPWAWEESTLPPTVLLWGRWAWMGVVVGWLPRSGCDESYVRWYSEVIHWRQPNPHRNFSFPIKKVVAPRGLIFF